MALPFAVLRIGGSASDVGYVAAAYLVPLIGFLLLGGVVADRLPRHQVMVAANALQALAKAASAVLLLAGASVEVFSVNWATTMQHEIPPAMLSRLSYYDALGSFALAPVGTAVAGPLAASFGTSAVLTAEAVLIVLLTAAVLLVPEVRNMQRQAVSPGRPTLT